MTCFFVRLKFVDIQLEQCIKPSVIVDKISCQNYCRIKDSGPTYSKTKFFKSISGNIMKKRNKESAMSAQSRKIVQNGINRASHDKSK